MKWFIEHIQPQIWSSLVIVLLLSIFAIVVGKKVDKLKPEDKPPKLICLIEALVQIINNFVRENIGEKRWRSIAPYVLTLALYLTCANLWNLTGMVAPTSSWNVTLALGLISWVLVLATAIKSNGLWKYIKSLFQPLPFLFPVNLIGELVLPFSLSLRLFGNILSGAVMGKLIYGIGGWWVVPLMPVFHAIFDVFFGMIQVLVFCLLTIIFIGQKVNENEFKKDENKELIIQEES